MPGSTRAPMRKLGQLFGSSSLLAMVLPSAAVSVPNVSVSPWVCNRSRPFCATSMRKMSRSSSTSSSPETRPGSETVVAPVGLSPWSSVPAGKDIFSVVVPCAPSQPRTARLWTPGSSLPVILKLPAAPLSSSVKVSSPTTPLTRSPSTRSIPTVSTVPLVVASTRRRSDNSKRKASTSRASARVAAVVDGIATTVDEAAVSPWSSAALVGLRRTVNA